MWINKYLCKTRCIIWWQMLIISPWSTFIKKILFYLVTTPSRTSSMIHYAKYTKNTIAIHINKTERTLVVIFQRLSSSIESMSSLWICFWDRMLTLFSIPHTQLKTLRGNLTRPPVNKTSRNAYRSLLVPLYNSRSNIFIKKSEHATLCINLCNCKPAIFAKEDTHSMFIYWEMLSTVKDRL